MASEPGEPPIITEHRVRGFPVRVINNRPDIDTGQVLIRLTQALDLIASGAPRCFRRLSGDLSGFLVQRFPCRGAFFPAERVCLVELTFAVNAAHSLPEIAASIVHEATHARVAARCGSLPASLRAREERLCRKAELDFGLTIADGTVVERARRSLALSDDNVAPAVDWTIASRRMMAADRDAPSSAAVSTQRHGRLRT
jgi:hypothetical protein